ncbi:hypothetical protein PRLR5025_31890 [Prevotella lacticifex]|nr:hypothetical protein PRLR5025_31890 [Prevotella lacticifex]
MNTKKKQNTNQTSFPLDIQTHYSFYEQILQKKDKMSVILPLSTFGVYY